MSEGQPPEIEGVPLRLVMAPATAARRRANRDRRGTTSPWRRHDRLREQAIGCALLVLILSLVLFPAALGPPESAGAHTVAASGSGGTSTPTGGEGTAGSSGTSGSSNASGSSGSAGGGDSTGSTGPGAGGSTGSSTASGEGASGEEGAPSEAERTESRTHAGGSAVALLGGAMPAALGTVDERIATGIVPMRQKLAHQMALAGRAGSAYVYDVSAEEPLYSVRAGLRRAPASVEKLYTSTAALMKMGPGARLATTVMSTGHLAAGGVFEGNLYLVGDGDPTFGARAFIAGHYGDRGTAVSTLVQKLKASGIRRVDGDIEGDESLWDDLRGDPSSRFAPDIYLEGTLSALEFDRGEYGKLKGPHAPAAYAALQLKRALEAGGVKVSGRSGAASTPARAVTIAVAPSPRLSVLLGLMLPPSDNFFAESLVKDLGAIYAEDGTTDAGIEVVRSQIKRLGLTPQIVDGSGLDRGDLTSPEQVVGLLRTLAGTADGRILRADMAVAGESGTLEARMLKSFATGRCVGKTGTLTGVSNLAGYCEAANGDLIAFAFFDDDIATYSAHVIQDAMTETVADY